jgi:tripartite-type tricarboxylate transporter receptor subunit TctC
MIKRIPYFLVILVVFVSIGTVVFAEEIYPSKPIRSVVPFPPGGATDLIVRALGDSMPKYLKQPFITTNFSGASGLLGINEVVKSKPDGYTIVSCGATIAMPELYIKFNQTPLTSKDLAPVAQWSTFIQAVVVKKDAPWKTMKEFMEAAKAKGLKFGGPGKTSGNFVIGMALAKKFNVNLVGIPFKGDAESIAALLGGHIDMAILVIASVQPHVEAGTLRLLAVTNDERLSDFPDIPTMAEAGYDVGLSYFPFGTYVHKDTPADRIRTLSEAIKKTAAEESFRSTMKRLRMPVKYLDTEPCAKILAATKKVVTEVFQDLGYLDK